jgi:hypothetical protein
VAAVATTATLVLGVPAFMLFYRRGWLGWWQLAFGGACIGLVCVFPFAVGGTAVAGALAPTFVALGVLHGLLFWVLAVWRNVRLTPPSSGHRASGARDT